MRIVLPLLTLLLVTACGKDPEAREAPQEDLLTAKAVADVDAAMAEARRSPSPAPTAAPATPAN